MFFVNIRSCFASDAIIVFEKLMLKRNFHGKTFSIYKFNFPPTLIQLILTQFYVFLHNLHNNNFCT